MPGRQPGFLRDDDDDCLIVINLVIVITTIETRTCALAALGVEVAISLTRLSWVGEVGLSTCSAEERN